MPDLDLDAIRRALEEATSGDWYFVGPTIYGGVVSPHVSVCNVGNIKNPTIAADRHLICLLRNSAPALLAEIERLRRVEAAAREYRREWHSAGGNAALLGDKLDAALDAALGGAK